MHAEMSCAYRRVAGRPSRFRLQLDELWRVRIRFLSYAPRQMKVLVVACAAGLVLAQGGMSAECWVLGDHVGRLSGGGVMLV